MCRKILKISIIGIIIIFISVVCFLFFKNYKKTEFLDCTLYNILQLTTALFVAIFVAHFIKNKYSDYQVQKRLFIEVVNDVSVIVENETPALIEFMEKETKAKYDRSKIFLLLKKIGNKITILERQKEKFAEKNKQLITDLRSDHDFMKQLITDDLDFFENRVYSRDNINKVLKTSFDILFKLDQIKLNIFK